MTLPRITHDAWTDLAAFEVFKHLDPHDQLETEVARGVRQTHLSLFSDWRSAGGTMVLNRVISEQRAGGQRPFALLALTATGLAGVAEAAFLSRDHDRFRMQIRAAALHIRHHLPDVAPTLGLHRIEARCWSGHPTAATFLTSIGFSHEVDQPGFGVTGAETFRLFSWVAKTSTSQPKG